MAVEGVDSARREVGSAALLPYLPRLVVDWLREDPAQRQRELVGTMAFVDISGFTSMSERLSQRGKTGAEEVTEVMNATFARLLDVAYAYGGSLLKFGGDALLLFFHGEQHERRAASAAIGMRRALRQAGRPQTSVGPVQLRMHVGLHTGLFHYFLVGDLHRELIVTGPAATTTVAMEAGAEAGEILASTATAAALPTSVLGEARTGGVLVRADPRGQSRFEPLGEVEGIGLEDYVPVAVREILAAGAGEGEHRQAAVAFVRFSGADELLEQGGPEATADAVEELVRTVQRAAAVHGVSFLESDIDRDGGRIVLVSGVPVTAGDDEERILRAARAIVEQPGTLDVRIGVNRGRVFAGEVGASFRRTYTILGDTAALAARLMARAEPGRVLAAEAVVERSRTTFDVRQLEPFQVKGKAEPIRALEVGPVAGARAAAAVTETPLVGREREMAILAAALGPARAGFGSVVELIGEAGLGKSRLVRALRAEAAELAVVSAACDPYQTSTPYYAFREFLRSVLTVPLDDGPAANTEQLRRRLEAVAPELIQWVPLLADPLDVAFVSTPEVDELQPAFRRARLHGLVETLLATLIPDPALLVFEDVHWMDDASTELLRHLAGRVQSHPWVICSTRRPSGRGFMAADGVLPVPAITFRLEPLAPDAAMALVNASAGRTLLDHEIEAITARAGGNPLFLQELVASSDAEADSGEELPESVEAVLASRIDELAARDRILLRWASVLGTSFSGELVESVLAEAEDAKVDSESWDRLAEFVERDPYAPGMFRFRHALIRDAAYEGLSFRRREELHARVGSLFESLYGAESDDYAATLSLHYQRARIYDKTWTYSLAAGDRARAKYANVEAAEFYRRAIDASRRLPQLEPAAVVQVWESIGDATSLAGLYDDATDAYKNARRLLPQGSDALPGLLHKEGRLRESIGRYSEALRWYGQGFKTLERLPSKRARRSYRIELKLDYAAARFRQGHLKECVRWGREAVEEAHAASDLRGLARGYYLLHLAYTSLGSPERVAFRGLALPIYEELGDLGGQAKTLNNMGIDAYYEGRWDDALDCYRLSKEFMDRIGDVLGAATLTNNIGEILSDQGQLEDAVELFEEVKRVTDAAGELLLSTVARANLGRAAARAGRIEEADELLDAAVKGFESIKAAGFVLEARARLAELAVFAGGQPEVALERAQATLEQAREAGSTAALTAMLERICGYALLQAGDLPAALEALEASLVTGRPAKVDYEIALTLNALAEAGASNADALAEESGRILERLGVVSVPRVPLP